MERVPTESSPSTDNNNDLTKIIDINKQEMPCSHQCAAAAAGATLIENLNWEEVSSTRSVKGYQNG